MGLNDARLITGLKQTNPGHPHSLLPATCQIRSQLAPRPKSVYVCRFGILATVHFVHMSVGWSFLGFEGDYSKQGRYNYVFGTCYV